ncbi:MAG: EamA family transporter [Streptomycetaceae bacterium]|nr:EamA family transporter [Streptomycetaceae bacterium]
MPAPRGGRAAGVCCAVAGQLSGGVQPLFWRLLDALDTSAIIAHRIVWSAVAAVAFVLPSRTARHELRVLVRDVRAVVSLASTGVLLAASWALYVYAVISGRVVEASLALLVAPLAGAVLGVAVLGERLRPAQWFACGTAAVALLVLVAGYGRVPWAAFAIATTVATYGLVRKRRPLPAAAGTAIELATVFPVGLAVVVCTGGGTGRFTPGLLVLLPAAGLITALPSLLRSVALGRIPLSVFSLLMYLNPALQFGIGVVVLREPMTGLGWTGFALVWAALAVFAGDALHGRRRGLPEDAGTRTGDTAAQGGADGPRDRVGR